MVSQTDENKFEMKLSGDQKINNFEGQGSPESNALIKTEELVRKIPLFNEKLDVTKKTEKGNLIIEKKWVTVKKKVEIPLKYEEIFINGKVFDSYNDKELSEIFSRIKSKISDVFLHERTDLENNKQDEPIGSEIAIVSSYPDNSFSLTLTRSISPSKLSAVEIGIMYLFLFNNPFCTTIKLSPISTTSPRSKPSVPITSFLTTFVQSILSLLLLTCTFYSYNKMYKIIWIEILTSNNIIYPGLQYLFLYITRKF